MAGTGHDAVDMARLAPAGMVFIPCKDGISHNEIEVRPREPWSMLPVDKVRVCDSPGP